MLISEAEIAKSHADMRPSKIHLEGRRRGLGAASSPQATIRAGRSRWWYAGPHIRWTPPARVGRWASNQDVEVRGHASWTFLPMAVQPCIKWLSSPGTIFAWGSATRVNNGKLSSCRAYREQSITQPRLSLWSHSAGGTAITSPRSPPWLHFVSWSECVTARISQCASRRPVSPLSGASAAASLVSSSGPISQTGARTVPPSKPICRQAALTAGI